MISSTGRSARARVRADRLGARGLVDADGADGAVALAEHVAADPADVVGHSLALGGRARGRLGEIARPSASRCGAGSRTSPWRLPSVVVRPAKVGASAGRPIGENCQIARRRYRCSSSPRRRPPRPPRPASARRACAGWPRRDGRRCAARGTAAPRSRRCEGRRRRARAPRARAASAPPRSARRRPRAAGDAADAGLAQPPRDDGRELPAPRRSSSGRAASSGRPTSSARRERERGLVRAAELGPRAPPPPPSPASSSATGSPAAPARVALEPARCRQNASSARRHGVARVGDERRRGVAAGRARPAMRRARARRPRPAPPRDSVRYSPRRGHADRVGESASAWPGVAAPGPDEREHDERLVGWRAVTLAGRPAPRLGVAGGLVPAALVELPAGGDREDVDVRQVLVVRGAVLDRLVDVALATVVAVHSTPRKTRLLRRTRRAHFVLALPSRRLDRLARAGRCPCSGRGAASMPRDGRPGRDRAIVASPERARRARAHAGRLERCRRGHRGQRSRACVLADVRHARAVQRRPARAATSRDSASFASPLYPRHQR